MSKKLKNELVKGNRSQAEQLAINYLRFYFKKLKVLTNDKTAIGKELDIYLPELRVGIEVDGIFHTLPIHGEQRLEAIKRNDAKKDSLCEQNNIKLIRITLPTDSRVYPQFIKSEIKNTVVPAILEWQNINLI